MSPQPPIKGKVKQIWFDQDEKDAPASINKLLMSNSQTNFKWGLESGTVSGILTAEQVYMGEDSLQLP